MLQNQDYTFFASSFMMNSKQPMKQVDVCLVSTKDYVFYIPKKSVGMFIVLNTIKTHQYFDGVSIEDGVQKIISNSETPQDLEKSLIALLEDDEKFVHKIADKTVFKFNSFLGKHTLRMSIGKMNWSSTSPGGKGNSKLFRTYYGQ